MTDISPIRLTAFEPQPVVPTITHYPEDMGDAPELHRWRAQWDSYDGYVRGIYIHAYPVISVTPQGAWIDTHAWRERTNTGHQWSVSGQKRWVSNTGGAAWAKPTQDEALHSIAVRLSRWSGHVFRDAEKVRQAAEALKSLRPQDGYLGDNALLNLRGI